LLLLAPASLLLPVLQRWARPPWLLWLLLMLPAQQQLALHLCCLLLLHQEPLVATLKVRLNHQALVACRCCPDQGILLLHPALAPA
jgi:hypothetical protein